MNRNQPIVSIIIPSFNRDHIINDTLDSVLFQSYRNWECIIVDDGSTDDSSKVIRKYLKKDLRFKFYKRPNTKPKGPSSCRNFGVSKSEGKYLIFLDSDDVLAETCLENRIKVFDKQNKLDFVVFSMGVFNETNFLKIDQRRKVFQGNQMDTIKQFLAHKYPWNTTRPLYKKEFIVNLEGFNENLVVFTDPELALRMLLTRKVKYISVDITDCYYRVDSDYKARYNDAKFKKTRINNYYKFVASFLGIMDNKQLILYKDELKYMYFKFCQEYYNYSNTIIKNKIKQLFYEKVHFNFMERFFLLVSPFIKSKRNIRGFFRLNLYCESYFLKNVILDESNRK